MKINIRQIYLYLFSFVGLLIMVMGSIRMVDLGIKTFIFPDSEYYESYPVKIPESEDEIDQEEINMRQRIETTKNRQRELSSSLAMLIVGTPLYLYHWKTIQKENK